MPIEVSSLTFEVTPHPTDPALGFLIFRTDLKPKVQVGCEPTHQDANDFITGYVWGARGSQRQADAPEAYYRGHHRGKTDVRT